MVEMFFFLTWARPSLSAGIRPIDNTDRLFQKNLPAMSLQPSKKEQKTKQQL